jgi:hypothetical protein
MKHAGDLLQKCIVVLQIAIYSMFRELKGSPDFWDSETSSANIQKDMVVESSFLFLLSSVKPNFILLSDLYL